MKYIFFQKGTMMKRAALFILALLSTFTVAYIIFGFVFQVEETEPDPHPSITVENDEMTQEQIAEKLMEMRFKSFTARNIEKRLRIQDFKIYSVYITKQTETGFIFDIIFAVKPYIYQSDWQAGNGGYNERSGWIEHKAAFVRVIQQGNTYIYDRSATGGFYDD